MMSDIARKCDIGKVEKHITRARYVYTGDGHDHNDNPRSPSSSTFSAGAHGTTPRSRLGPTSSTDDYVGSRCS